MLEQDNLFTIIAMLSLCLALVLCAGLVLSSFGHLFLTLGRISGGKPARFDGWTAARALVIVAVVAGVAAFAGFVGVGEGLATDIVIFTSLFALLCTPLLINIFRIRIVDMEKPANQTGHRRLGLALKNLLYICALPGMMTAFVMSGVALESERRSSGGMLSSAWNAPAHEGRVMNYYMLPRPTQCSTYLRTVVPLLLDKAPRSPDHMVHAAEFWLDTTLNALTFSAFDTSGCYVRRVDYNRENIRMVAAVAVYNLILVFVISTIVYSVFKHKVRKGVERATAGRAEAT